MAALLSNQRLSVSTDQSPAGLDTLDISTCFNFRFLLNKATIYKGNLESQTNGIMPM